MKTKTYILAGVSCLLTCLLSFGGNESGGGGFAFTNSKRLLKKATKETLDRISKMDGDCINAQMATAGAGPVDLLKMGQIISKVRSNYLDERVRINADGQKEPLVFDYGTDQTGEYIEALKLFFVGFISYQDDLSIGFKVDDNISLVDKLLIHEASHHFGYTETQAERLAHLVVGPLQISFPPSPSDDVDCGKKSQPK